MNQQIHFLLLAFAFTFSAQTLADQPSAKTPERLKKELHIGLELLRSGNTQADAKEHNQAQATYHQAMEKILPSVRGLPFLNPVKRDETPREKLGEYLIRDWEKDITPEEFQADEATWKALGLIPPDFDLKSTYIQLLTEEVAAFYDPKTQTMHLIREPDADKADPPKPMGLLDLIMNRPKGFDKDEARTVIAHELTHALDDQHFHLQSMMETVRDDDDASMALSALMEGEATLTMMAVSQEDWDGSLTTKIDAAGLQRVIKWTGPFLMMSGGKTARKAPKVMYESMIFPYFQGLVFCTSITNQRGWAGLNQAYANPPLSTEQILHPEKYSGPNQDLPTQMEIESLKPPTGYQKIGSNVIGEFTINQLFPKLGAEKIGAGWDGDTLFVFQNQEKPADSILQYSTIWVSTWDSHKDAVEFAEAIVKLWATERDRNLPIDTIFQKSNSFADKNLMVEINNEDVLILRGFNPDLSKQLQTTVWKNLKKSPKSFDWKRNPE